MWLTNKSIAPLNWMSEKPFFSAFRTEYVCVQKPPSKTQLVHFMTTYFCMAYITVPRQTRVRIAMFVKRVEATRFFHSPFCDTTEPRVNQIWIKMFALCCNDKWYCGWIFPCSTLHSVWFCTWRNAGFLRSHFNLKHIFLCASRILFQGKQKPFLAEHFYAPQNIFLCIVEAMLESVLECTKKSEGVMSLDVMRLYLFKVKQLECEQDGFSCLFSEWN